jgi:hypothetical protein
LLLIAELASLVFTAALVMSFRHAGFWPGFGGELFYSSSSPISS